MSVTTIPTCRLDGEWLLATYTCCTNISNSIIWPGPHGSTCQGPVQDPEQPSSLSSAR